MVRRCNLWALLGMWVFCMWTDGTSVAQVRRYQPASPTISPYLNLTRFNNGSLPNYYSLVRPELNQREFNVRERNLRQEHSGSLRKLENKVQQGLQPAAPTGTGSWFMMPAGQSTHLDTRGFYPSPVIRSRR